MRESGIQGAESIAAGSLGAAAATRAYTEVQTGNLLQRGTDWLAGRCGSPGGRPAWARRRRRWCSRSMQGGTNGVLVDDTLRFNGALAPEASLPFLTLYGGSSGVQALSPLLEQIAVGAPGETVGMVVRNAAPTGASLLLDSNNQNGVAELVVLSGGGVQLNSFQQFISFNNTSGLANMAIEPNIGLPRGPANLRSCQTYRRCYVTQNRRTKLSAELLNYVGMRYSVMPKHHVNVH